MQDKIEQSELLDVNWYFDRYPDVRKLGMTPAEHYLRIGARLLRDPGPEFSTAFYLATNPDVKQAGTNPLWHYITYGRDEGRQIARSGSHFAAPEPVGAAHEDGRAAAIRRCSIMRSLDNEQYLAMRQDVADSGFWDERWYLSKYYFQFLEYKKNLRPSEYSAPLDHYLVAGWKIGCEPSDRLPLQIAQADLPENKIAYFLNTLRFKGYHFDKNPWVPKQERIAEYIANKKCRKSSRVIYTCIANGYDNLMQPYHIVDDWDYVCFTDDPELVAKRTKGVWDIRQLSTSNADSARVNRWHKMHPHVLFPDYQESVYVDGNINIISSYLFDQIGSRCLNILLPEHFVRNCTYQEIEALMSSQRFDDDQKRQFENCRKFLEKEGFPVGNGLTENNVIYRKHHEKLVVTIMDQWWTAYLGVSPRDQTTLSYVFWKNGLDISHHTVANCRLNYRDFWIVKHNRLVSASESRVEAKALHPAFETNNVGVVFSTNEYFVPYLGVAIFSLLKNSSARYNYDIIVLGRGLSAEAQAKIGALAEHRPNVSIRFYDMGDIYDSLPEDLFHVEGYVPVETYNKCFITKVLSGYERCVYLDSDIVVVDDVQKLHDTPLDGHAIAASVNVANINAAYCKKEIKGRKFDDYLKELGVLERDKYFQAGVLVLDMSELNKMGLVEKSLQCLREVYQPVFFDQCIFNSIFYNNVKFISTAWNHVWYMQNYSYLRGSVAEDVFFDYARGRVDPKIIHFASKDKPHTKYGWELGSVFWEYTYDSPFKEEVLQRLAETDNEVSNAMRGADGDHWYSVTPRLLIHIHLYYIDQLDEMLNAISHVVGCEYDLYVTMIGKSEEAERRIKEASPDATILIVPNVGYDIYPFLRVLEHVRLSQYQYVLKIHTKNKRDPGQDVVYGIKVPGYEWRDELINSVVGSKEIFSRNLSTLLQNKSVGCLGAKRFVFSTTQNREETTYHLPEWRKRCGVVGGSHYVGGSMFLARAYPFERLKGLRMHADDFKSTQMGTKDHKNIAHIFERLLGIVVENEGFEIVGV